MPLPTDKAAVETSEGLVKQLHQIFGEQPGYRPAHAKGILLTGTFIPSPTAATLSSAPHFTAISTPVTVRFSNSTGIPNIPDTAPDADPRGCAIRFHLPSTDGRRRHTDIVAHSTPHFPTHTGADFLTFLKAAASSPPDGPHPSPVEQFVAAHPETQTFLAAPKPAPESYATEEFYSVTAFKLIAADGKETYIRYTVSPRAGIHKASESFLKSASENYLQQDIKARIAKGPVEFDLKVQIAEEGDITDLNTEHWPSSRKVVSLGTIKIDKVVEDAKQREEQKYIIFDPIPRVKGVDVSKDPLLDVRAGVYLISGKERRAAPL